MVSVLCMYYLNELFVYLQSELDNIETNLFASLRPSKQKTSNKEIIKDSTIPTKRLFGEYKKLQLYYI